MRIFHSFRYTFIFLFPDLVIPILLVPFYYALPLCLIVPSLVPLSLCPFVPSLVPLSHHLFFFGIIDVFLCDLCACMHWFRFYTFLLEQCVCVFLACLSYFLRFCPGIICACLISYMLVYFWCLSVSRSWRGIFVPVKLLRSMSTFLCASIVNLVLSSFLSVWPVSYMLVQFLMW